MALDLSKLTLPLHNYNSCHVGIRSGKFVIHFHAVVAGGEWVMDQVDTSNGLAGDITTKLAEGRKIIRAARNLAGYA